MFQETGSPLRQNTNPETLSVQTEESAAVTQLGDTLRFFLLGVKQASVIASTYQLIARSSFVRLSTLPYDDTVKSSEVTNLFDMTVR